MKPKSIETGELLCQSAHLAFFQKDVQVKLPLQRVWYFELEECHVGCWSSA
jgi:hypothetical protein